MPGRAPRRYKMDENKTVRSAFHGKPPEEFTERDMAANLIDCCQFQYNVSGPGNHSPALFSACAVSSPSAEMYIFSHFRRAAIRISSASSLALNKVKYISLQSGILPLSTIIWVLTIFVNIGVTHIL
ncbi:hypothetical protein [Flintibacter muris]|uniref:hypothetical protein n=1 Tax=Flintibacter muris TaxID=2941327 RepID=UPI00203C1E61|nr:hypothetical protein [Flintibacter muris]